MEKVSRNDKQFAAVEINAHTFIRDGFHPVHDTAVNTEMGNKTSPYRLHIGIRIGDHQPAVDGCHDVGILMGEKQVFECGWRQEFRHGGKYF